jgi:hypothetical protein
LYFKEKKVIYSLKSVKYFHYAFSYRINLLLFRENSKKGEDGKGAFLKLNDGISVELADYSGQGTSGVLALYI